MCPKRPSGLVSVEVALYANLRRYRPEDGGTGPFWLKVPAGTTVEGLMNRLGIPAKLVKQAFVDHVQQDRDYVLTEGARVAIFSPIAGGQVRIGHGLPTAEGVAANEMGTLPGP